MSAKPTPAVAAAEGGAKKHTEPAADGAAADGVDDGPPQAKRGRPVSGRVWKQPRRHRSSAVVVHPAKDTGPEGKGHVVKPGKKMLTAFQRREQEKQKRLRAKELESRLTNQRIERKRGERERRLKAAKKKTETTLQNSVVQAIKPSKLKTMSKKQLRQVRKTSVEADGTVVLISPWQKRADHHHIAVRGKRKASGKSRRQG